jgi:DNA-binding response OmpR family regulator
MGAIKILLADDEEGMLSIMSKKVTSVGYEAILARDGEEAWTKIKSENPDVIILDLNMPKMDGWQVLKELRSNPPSKKWQPVIIVSTAGEVRNIQTGFDMQADHYLIKPCLLEDIIKAIRLMISLIPMRNV